MKKWSALLLFLLMSVLLVACQDQVTPDERLQQYVDAWNEQDFSTMYDDYTAKSSTDSFPKEESVDRQVKIYQDLEVANVSVEMQDIPEDTEWPTEEAAVLPVTISFDTLAGPLSFEKEVSLVFEERGEEENWFVEWDPSFILPDLKKDETVGIRSTGGVRGQIFDRNGNPLAINGSGYQVGVVPGELADGDKAALADEIGLSVEAIDQQLGQGWVTDEVFVPLKKYAASEQPFIAELTESIPGVYSQSVEMREYPYGEAISHLTGFVGPISAEQLEAAEGEGYSASSIVGKRGLEELLEDRLRPQTGASIYITKLTGEDVTVVEQKAQNGEDITLTIDMDLQQKAYDAMEGLPGTAAAVDPETGETLVLASSPGFNPTEFSLGVSADRYQELEEDPDQPLLNRFAVSYAPGSTQKTLTAAIGLEAGTLDPNEGFNFSGLTWQKDNWGDFKVTRVVETANPVDLNKGLVFSDNIYFAQVSLDMGADTLIEGLKGLGYEEEMPFSYPTRTSQISNDGSIGSEGQLVDTSYGQGEMLTNIVHLASMYEIVLTDGTIMKPLLFEEEEPEVWKEGLLSAENAAILREDLREAVTIGFATPANIPEVEIAGKTGTAELKLAGEESGKENGFFVAYDQQNRDFVLAMMIEGVEDIGGSKYVSELATNVFRD